MFLLCTVLCHALLYIDSSSVLVILASEHLLEAHLSFLFKSFCHSVSVVENCKHPSKEGFFSLWIPVYFAFVLIFK